jgi:hypothetical protein
MFPLWSHFSMSTSNGQKPNASGGTWRGPEAIVKGLFELLRRDWTSFSVRSEHYVVEDNEPRGSRVLLCRFHRKDGARRRRRYRANTDPFFLPAGAKAFTRDNPDAEVHFYDTGHFALETHVGEIANAIREFLGRKLVS